MAQTTMNSQAQTEPLSNGSPATVETDLLIVGTGPAGASLACFLTSHGKRTLVLKPNFVNNF